MLSAAEAARADVSLMDGAELILSEDGETRVSGKRRQRRLRVRARVLMGRSLTAAVAGTGYVYSLMKGRWA